MAMLIGSREGRTLSFGENTAAARIPLKAIQTSSATPSFAAGMSWHELEPGDALQWIASLGPTAQLSGFQSPQWLAHLVAVLHDDASARSFFIGGFSDAGVLSVVLPLCLRNEMGVRRLEWLGQTVSDYNGPIAAPEALALISNNDVLPVWKMASDFVGGADVIFARKQYVRIGGAHNPFARIAASNEADRAHEIDLSAMSDLSGLVSRKSRRRLREKHNALAKRGSMEIRQARSNAEIASAITKLIAHKSRQLQASGQSNPFDDHMFREFLIKTTSDLTLQAHCLTLNAEPIAITLLLAHGKTQLLYQTAYDNAFSQHSPGRILTFALIEQALREGYTVFDFGFGDEEYKRPLSNRSRDLTCSIIPLTARGMFAANMYRVSHALRRTIKNRSHLRSLALKANRWRTANRCTAPVA